MITRHLESSAAARPTELGSGGVSDEDLAAMMESRPMTEVDLATPEVAAANGMAGVLAGEAHVITHGALRDAVFGHHASIEEALARVDARQQG